MRTLLLFFAICLGAAPAVAHVSSISAGTGSAGRAVTEPLENPYMNPAGLPFQKGYFFGAGLARLNTETYGAQDVFSLALTDNMPDTILPTSLAYTDGKNSNLGELGRRRDFRLGIGNFYNRNLALGFALNYRMSQSPVFNETQVGATIGALVPLRPEWTLGLVVENAFSNSKNTLPEAERLDPTTALGLSYNYRKFMRLRADLISQAAHNWGNPIWAVGLENYWNRWLIVRIGGQVDTLKDTTAETAGVGFAGPKFELQYAFQNIRGPERSEGRHSIDLGLPLW